MKFPTPPKLVIFDCDGVIVDSEPIFNRILCDFLNANGANISFSECCTLFVGKNRHDVERYLTDLGTKLPTDWSTGFYAQAFDALAREVVPIKGIKPVLQRLAGSNIPFCVASNGMTSKMDVTLGKTGMLHLFEGNIFSAYDIGKSKPAPDVFLFAADANRVQASDCIVIEDSPSGLQAAQNANMACFAYRPERDGDKVELFGARPFHTMDHLPELLGIL